MKKSLLLFIGLLILIVIEILKVYFIMPFPGSQRSNSIDIAYFIHNNIRWIRLGGIILIAGPLVYYLTKGKRWQKIILLLVLVLYGVIVYAFNFKFLADKMFYQPTEKTFATSFTDSAKNKLVIGVALHGEAKAYPIEIIGYHHQVKDTLGNEPVMVTYCTVCRTGRVYSPFVNGKYELFRLVGMDHFNAMFEDATTKSWWQQATGKAITGKLKGTQLPEIPSSQMRLGDWLALHPNSQVLQPDKNFSAKYDSLKGYDEGTIESSLEKRDTASWQFKSWVVGVVAGGKSKAYDWNDLLKRKIIQDSVNTGPLLITVEPNNKTFYVLSRAVQGKVLHFSYDASTHRLHDAETNSVWSLNGSCTEGTLKGKQLDFIQSYQEFWHSWQSFHPGTEKYL